MHKTTGTVLGEETSRIHLGTATFGISPTAEAATALVSRALDLGITVFDTADSYGNQREFDRPGVAGHLERSSAEEILGRALHGVRDSVCIASKVGEPLGEQRARGPFTTNLSPAHIRAQLTESLRRLQTDRIDLYYAHHPDPGTPVDETAGAFDDLVREGLIREWAVSNHSGQQWTSAASAAHHRPMCNQVRYSLAARGVETNGVCSAADQLSGSLVAYSPLAGGLLAGQAAMTAEYAGESRWGGSGFTATQRSLGERITDIACEYSLDPAVLSIAWLLDRPHVGAVVVGTSSPEKLVRLCQADTITLDDALRTALDTASSTAADAKAGA
ncbi:aldo/keto reductase [Gordonia sp. NPDC003504]